VVPGAIYSPVINPSHNENFSTSPTRLSPPPSNVGVSRIFFHRIEMGEKKVVNYPIKFFGIFPYNSWALFFSEWQQNRVTRLRWLVVNKKEFLRKKQQEKFEVANKIKVHFFFLKFFLLEINYKK
jgi:hypothetical protein